jgi:hypothetical protein
MFFIKKFQKGLLKIKIMATSKQYMADDSISESDMKRVVDIFPDSSGCWAMDCIACLATEDSPIAVIEAPKATPHIAAIMDIVDTITKFSIFSPNNCYT